MCKGSLPLRTVRLTAIITDDNCDSLSEKVTHQCHICDIPCHITAFLPKNQWAPYIWDGRFSEKNDLRTNTCPKPTHMIAKVTKTLQIIVLSFRSSALCRP